MKKEKFSKSTSKTIHKIIYWLLVLLLLSQAVKAQDICIPEKTVDKIILTLHDHEILKVKYQKADSTLKVYSTELESRKQIITKQKITLDQYHELVTKLDLKITNQDAKLYEARKKNRKLIVGHILRTVIEVGVVVLIIAL